MFGYACGLLVSRSEIPVISRFCNPSLADLVMRAVAISFFTLASVELLSSFLSLSLDILQT